MGLKKCKECGHQVSSKAKTCPNCGYDLKSSGFVMKSVGCLAWVFIFFLGFNWVMSCELPEPQPWDVTDNSTMAYIQMESFVEDRLVSPSTAEFPGPFDGYEQHISRDGHIYTINSYVDSENRMGASLRTHFTGVIEQVDKDTWQLKSLELHE